MATLYRDLRYGLRVLKGSLGFTAVAVLTLALGIAVNTTVFSWIDTVLLRPIPGARAAHELAVFETVRPNGEFIRTSFPDFRDYRDSLKLISGLTGIFGTTLRLGDGDHGQVIWAELVTGNYFDVLGVKPALGRFFLPEEVAYPPASFPVAVLSYRLWRTRFQGDRSLIGKIVRVNRRPLTVIGVAPPEFQGITTGLAYDLWAPHNMIVQLNRAPADTNYFASRGAKNLDVFARLRPGVTIEQARSEIAARARDLARANPATNTGVGATIEPLPESHTGTQRILRQPLRILMAVCAIVLLIVCANVANLLLARSTGRQKELAIRVAIGAGRWRVARQLLTETLLLAGAGAALGVLFAMWLGPALGWLLPPVNVPLRLDTTLNWRVLAFTMLAGVTGTILSGIAPAVFSLRADVNEVLKEGGRGERSGARAHRLRGLLVVFEVALAAVALIGAGLFAKSFRAARAIHPGFDAGNVLIARFSLADTGYTAAEQNDFCQRLRRRLESAPGVVAVNYADAAPLGFDGGPWDDIQVEGYVPVPGESMNIYRSLIAPGYFSVLHIPLEGRDFTELDGDADAERVMIVNQSFARRFFEGGNPIGRKVRRNGRVYTVVGLAKDVKYHDLAGAPEPYFYVPYRLAFRTGLNTSFFVRTAGDPTAAIAMFRREAAAVDRNADALEVMPLAEHIGAALYPLKIAATLLAVLGGLAVLLAATGLYSVMAYAVSQRTHEVGIRMAVGAGPGAVLGMVVRQGLALAAAGLAVGAAAAFVLTRLVAGMLVRTGSADPATFAGAALFLGSVAALASYVPARRATRVDPMVALRCQ